MFSICEIFDLAIQIEKNGENFYRRGVKEVPNPSLTSLFYWLADAEVQHRQWFTQLKQTLEVKGKNREVEELSGSLLKDILGDRAFALSEADLLGVDQEEMLLHLAIEFEKDTILFYEVIRALVDDQETLTWLNKIITEEKNHILALEEFLGKKTTPPENSTSNKGKG